VGDHLEADDGEVRRGEVVQRPPWRWWFYLVLGLLPVLVPLLLLEAAGRVFLLLRPSYDVLFLQPDRAVGWKQVPNLEWTWAGWHWYANEFSVRIRTNSLGFRDRERERAKPEGVVRIAFLGDSFVEAAQVPLEKTAAQLLETRLNREPGPTRYEVLNFGISNYGVGQYLLAWEEYASQFAPDYVFALVAGLHLERTVAESEVGRFHTTASRALRLRPTFRLRGSELIRDPAADYDAFVAAQRELIEGEFGGRRSRRRETSLVAHLVKRLWARHAGDPGAVVMASGGASGRDPRSLIHLNLTILEELAAQAKARGARLVLADACPYLGGPEGCSHALRTFCTHRDVGYVPLGERLRAANSRGRSTRWRRDGHFNEAGNEVFAESMVEWMRKHAASQPAEVVESR